MDLPENVIFIIVFLIIGAVRWFLENVKKGKPPQSQHWEEYDYEEHADTVTPQKSSLEDLYKEARRDILDRQNRQLPEVEIVDPHFEPVQPPTPPPPLPPSQGMAQQAIEATTLPSEDAPYQIKEIQRPSLTPAEQQALVNLESMGQKETPKSASNNRIRKLLSDSTAARDAVILTEILGKPKGI